MSSVFSSVNWTESEGTSFPLFYIRQFFRLYLLYFTLFPPLFTLSHSLLFVFIRCDSDSRKTVQLPPVTAKCSHERLC